MSRSCQAIRLTLLIAFLLLLLVLSPAPGAAGNEPNAVVGRLVVALRSNDDKVSAAAVLGKTGAPQAVEPLIVALKDKRLTARSPTATPGTSR